MPSTAATHPLLGSLLALLAAISWGGGDFSGGMGVKAAGRTTRGALRVILTAHGLSLSALLLALLARRSFPLHGTPAAWGLGSGVVAGLSLAGFYVALARGEMGASAAISGLLAAAIPAAVGMALEGRPSSLHLAGFLVAALAIWLVAAPVPGAAPVRESREITLLALGGGIGFGIYFTMLRFANPLGILMPLALARIGSLLTCGLLLLCLPRANGLAPSRIPLDAATPLFPARTFAGLTRSGWFWAGGVALLDTGGNLLYIAATRAGRLDVAAVLASLYPASTILLAAALLHERPNARQLLGMTLALGAVLMVTL